MSWKQATAFLTIVFVIVTIQSVIARPLITFQNTLLDTGDYNNPHFAGEQLIQGLVSDWFTMGLVGIFVLMGVVIARVVRKELTRQGRQP